MVTVAMIEARGGQFHSQPSLTVAARDTPDYLRRYANFKCKNDVADEITIQKALEVLPTAGGTIYFLEGIYSITDNRAAISTQSSQLALMLLERSDIRIQGAGKGQTVFQFSQSVTDPLADRYLFRLYGSTPYQFKNVHFAGFSVIGTKANDHFLWVSGAEKVTLRDIEYSHDGVVGASVDEAVQLWGGVGTGSACRDVVIENSHFQGCGAAAIEIATDVAGANGMMSDIVVTKCSATTSSAGVYLRRVTDNTRIVTGIIISENHFYNNVTYGVNLADNSGNTVIGNTIEGNDSIGIHGTANALHNVIIGNTLRDNEGVAQIEINGSFNIIKGNTIGSGDGDGISLTVNGGDNIVDGNTIFEHNNNGIQALGPRNSITNNIIRNNGVTGSGNNDAGVFIDEGGTDTYLAGNNIYDDAANVQAHGIRFASGTPPTGCRLIGNRVHGNVTTDYSQVPTTVTSVNSFGNVNLVLLNQGTGSIATGATTAVITHGLAGTPTAAGIRITFAEQGSNDYGRWSVGTITSTQFTLTVAADPGASNLDFGWEARIV